MAADHDCRPRLPTTNGGTNTRITNVRVAYSCIREWLHSWEIRGLRILTLLKKGGAPLRREEREVFFKVKCQNFSFLRIFLLLRIDERIFTLIVTTQAIYA